MTELPKPASVKRDPAQYDKILREVFRRDNYRCRNCGKSPVTPHHIHSRGQRGADQVNNIITLCIKCHKRADVDPEFVLSIIKDTPGLDKQREYLERLIDKKQWRVEHGCKV